MLARKNNGEAAFAISLVNISQNFINIRNHEKFIPFSFLDLYIIRLLSLSIPFRERSLENGFKIKMGLASKKINKYRKTRNIKMKKNMKTENNINERKL